MHAEHRFGTWSRRNLGASGKNDCCWTQFWHSYPREDGGNLVHPSTPGDVALNRRAASVLAPNDEGASGEAAQIGHHIPAQHTCSSTCTSYFPITSTEISVSKMKLPAPLAAADTHRDQTHTKRAQDRRKHGSDSHLRQRRSPYRYLPSRKQMLRPFRRWLNPKLLSVDSAVEIEQGSHSEPSRLCTECVSPGGL